MTEQNLPSHAKALPNSTLFRYPYSVKGLILAGGSGSRLSPLTSAISKQLLPVYNKPLIYYPMSTLMLAGIREIMIVVNPNHLELFKATLGDGSQFGISLEYVVQEKPLGIAQGILLAEEFLGQDNFALILGDNVFYGSGLGRTLVKYSGATGAHIFTHTDKHPENFGVIEIDIKGEIKSIEEKPKYPKSNQVITGLYFFDKRAIVFVRELKPSKRGELEIIDVLQKYLELGQLNFTKLSLGTAWLDTGTFETLQDAGVFVRLVEERQGISFGNPFDIAVTLGWVEE